MRPGDLPTSGQLLAHVDTAFDAASRWVSRGLAVRPTDNEGWENTTYFTRVLLIRAADGFMQLGYVLGQESLAAQSPEEQTRTRTAIAYWQEARVDLDAARQRIADLAGSSPDDLVARHRLSDVNARLQAGGHWLEQMTELLQADRGPDRSPSGPALARVPEQYRPDDEWDLGVA